MSMHPHVKIVLGIELHAETKVTNETVTKYNENDGTPYQKVVTSRTDEFPEWFKKAWEERNENCDDWYETGCIGVFPEPCSGQSALAGMLLEMFDPREMGGHITLELPNSDDRLQVIRWLHEIGAPDGEYTMEDIKIYVGTDWL